MKTLFLIINLLTTNISSDPILPCGVNLPSHFNPNVNYGNLINIQTKGVVKLDMTIYDNWGQKVMKSDMTNYLSNPFFYESKTLEITDTNVSNNNYLNQDNYYYSVEFVCVNGDKISKEGELKLVKTTKK